MTTGRVAEEDMVSAQVRWAGELALFLLVASPYLAAAPFPAAAQENPDAFRQVTPLELEFAYIPHVGAGR